jgi:hypothetical protein
MGDVTRPVWSQLSPLSRKSVSADAAHPEVTELSVNFADRRGEVLTIRAAVPSRQDPGTAVWTPPRILAFSSAWVTLSRASVAAMSRASR